MNNSLSAVPRKVALIERQDTRHTVDSHQGDKSGVVYLDSSHIMVVYERSPHLIDLFAVRQERHRLLDRSNTP
jgi:hypothetical protein